jgi:L-lactate dehydrogenase complex protein LldG
MSSRDVVLARISAALGPRPAPEPVRRDYQRTGNLPPGVPALLDLLEDRLIDYRAYVRRSSSDEVPAVLAGLVAELTAGRTGGASLVVGVPPGLPLSWLAASPVEVRADDGTLGPADLDDLDGVVTAVAVAIAETGTLVLDGSGDQGRRALTLVPDLHVCVVHAGQVVETVPEAIARLAPMARRPLTFISGPSATSDIELARVEGVHGPRTLAVVLVDE